MRNLCNYEVILKKFQLVLRNSWDPDSDFLAGSGSGFNEYGSETLLGGFRIRVMFIKIRHTGLKLSVVVGLDMLSTIMYRYTTTFPFDK